jgi:hypothetical protein
MAKDGVSRVLSQKYYRGNFGIYSQEEEEIS